MKKNLILFAIALCIGHVVRAQQSKIFMPWFETINMKSDFKLSSTHLLKSYIENAGRYSVVLQSADDSVIKSLDQMDIITERAKVKSAQYFVIGTLNRLGENVIVNLSMYETSTGKKIWSDMMKAQSPDDLDPILKRIGKNIGTPESAKADDDIYSVTNTEEQALAQKQSINSFGIGLGGVAFLYPGQIQMTNFQLGWSYDARQFIFDINPSVSFNPNGSYIWGLSLEILKPLTSQANSFYYGGGLSMSNSNLALESNASTSYNGAGLSAMIGAGYVFQRSSSASLRVSINYVQSFYDLKSSYTSQPTYGKTPYQDNKGLSGGILLRLEILLRK